MNKPFLRYTPDLDKTIIKATEDDLNIHVIEAKKLEGGEFNYSYKIKTSDKMLIARVFRERNSPEDGKLEWIEEKLTEYNIPHAKTLFLTREDKYFPYGYMVQEFIEGMSGSEAIMEGYISFEEFFNQFVTTIQKVHNISVDRLGKIPSWAGKVGTFYEAGIAEYHKIHERLKSLKDIDDSIHQTVLEKVKKLKKYVSMYKTVLLHGDPGADNAILKEDGEMILIDWDNSVIGSWIEEYAGMTFRGAYLWRYKTDEERNNMLERSFRNYYKGVNFNDPNLREVVKILHILTAYGALSTHYFQHEDMKLYEIAKKRLISMLTQL